MSYLSIYQDLICLQCFLCLDFSVIINKTFKVVWFLFFIYDVAILLCVFMHPVVGYIFVEVHMSQHNIIGHSYYVIWCIS